MTREEAIEILKELWRYEKTSKFNEKQIREALEIAENALKMDKIYAIEFWDSTDYQYYVSTRYVFLTYKDAHDVLENTAHRDGQVVEIPVYVYRSKEDQNESIHYSN